MKNSRLCGKTEGKQHQQAWGVGYLTKFSKEEKQLMFLTNYEGGTSSCAILTMRNLPEGGNCWCVRIVHKRKLPRIGMFSFWSCLDWNSYWLHFIHYQFKHEVFKVTVCRNQMRNAPRTFCNRLPKILLVVCVRDFSLCLHTWRTLKHVGRILDMNIAFQFFPWGFVFAETIESNNQPNHGKTSLF